MAADRSSTIVRGSAFGGGPAFVRFGGAPFQPFDKKPTPGNDRNWVKCITATAMEGRP